MNPISSRLIPRRRLLALAAAFVSVLFASTTSADAAGTLAVPSAESFTDLKAGDVVFIHVGGPIFNQIAKASNTWVSHVGIIVGRKNGGWQVGEGAVAFSRISSLDSFLARSSTGQFAIRRLKAGLTPVQVVKLNAAVDQRLGKIYDFGFNLDARHSTFCSKFVYQVVQASNGEQLGQVETLRALLAENASMPTWFWRLWYFGRIPWDRKTITPESQYQSPLMTTVHARV